MLLFLHTFLSHRAYSWTDGGSDMSSVALWRTAGWQVYSIEIWSMTSPRREVTMGSSSPSTLIALLWPLSNGPSSSCSGKLCWKAL